MTDDQYRGLLTDREREILAGEADVSDDYRYRVVSRIRNKKIALKDDLVFLRQHRPDLEVEIRQTICDEYVSNDDE